MALSRLGRHLPPAGRRAARLPLLRYRHLGLRRSDALLVSYPKSGSTWLRWLLAHILTGSEADYESIRSVVPPIGQHRRAVAVLPDRGRLVRSHEPLRPFFGRAGQPVLYLVRDPRDVCVSYCNHRRRQGQQVDLAAFTQRFLSGRVDFFGRWPDHVSAAVDFDRRGASRVLWVRYEELRADPASELRRILGFLGVEIAAARVEEAVAANTRERMNEKEDPAFLRRVGMDGAQGAPLRGPWTELVPPALDARFEQDCFEAMVASGYRQQASDGRAGLDER